MANEPPEEIDLDRDLPDFATRPEVLRVAFFYWHLRFDALLHDPRGVALGQLVQALTALPAAAYCEWHPTEVDCRRERYDRHRRVSPEQAAAAPRGGVIPGRAVSALVKQESYSKQKPRRSGAVVGAESATACGARSPDRQGRDRGARESRVRERSGPGWD